MSGPSHSQEDAFASPPEAGGRLYFFDTDDGFSYVRDQQGLALKDADAARRHAQDALADIARGVASEGTGQWALTCQVRDEAGSTVLKAAIVLTIEMGP